ncbi:hypothetical protein [Nostoc sp. TCL26-01]|uniref:hypothetical protein n=1 Tax=Nostoc sp. TCL26-01 TaxID=2576904 RepID=UPI0015BF1D8B|nr:hypothetical protein [Nostoc sp. TCL26-01]QLE56136.1 hypothetical protein FD725_11685 [Nostoc sp. TCL26-01]
MKLSLIFIACAAFIVAGNSVYAVDNINHNYQRSIVYSHKASHSIMASSSPDYQISSVTISAANLRQPHILSISTSGSGLQGDLTYDGKVIQQIKGRGVELNLAPYLSVGQHQLKISTRYFPESASVSVRFTGPGVSVSQQTSASGVLNYILNISVS